MDDYLSSIPAVQKLLESENENESPKRDVIFQAIRAAFERSLGPARRTDEAEEQTHGWLVWEFQQCLSGMVEHKLTRFEEQIDYLLEPHHHTDENDDQEWLAELADLDLGDVDTDTDDNVVQLNSIDSMASLLTRYVVNRPWIPMVAPKPLNAEQLNDTTEGYRSVVEGDGHPAPPPSQSDRGKRSLLEYEDLADLLKFTTSEHKPGENGVAYVIHNEDIPTASEISDIIADSDRRLGLAGFLPCVSESRIPTGILDLRKIERSKQERENESMSQGRRHTRLTGHWVRVCLLPYTDSLQGSNYTSTVDYMGRRLEALILQIDILKQANGCTGDNLVFSRLKEASGETFAGDNQYYAEICELQVESIRGLADGLAKTKLTLIRSMDAWTGWLDRAIRVVTFIIFWPIMIHHAILSWAAGDSSQYKESVHESDSTLATQFVDNSCLRPDANFDWNESFRQLALWLALQPIPKVLGITKIKAEELDQHPSIVVLHLTALAVHSLTLIVQSNLRGLTVPCQFDFSSTVSDFVLEDANHSPSARKIYASSQKLSCLGDMLEKEVLVFGLKERDPQQRMDIGNTGSARLVMGPRRARGWEMRPVEPRHHVHTGDKNTSRTSHTRG